MTQQDLLKKKETGNLLKILMPLIVAFSAIVIFRGGYEFGKWLHVVLN